MTLLHERWFVSDQGFPLTILAPETWIPLAIAVTVTVGANVLWRLRAHRPLVPGPVELGMPWSNYERLLSWMPLVLGLHTAVPLLVSGVSLRLLVPNLELGSTFLGSVLGLAQIVIGLCFLYGALTRFASIGLAVVWVVGMIGFGPTRLLEQTLFLGIAFFLFVTGRGPLAFDMALQRLHRPIPKLLPYAVPALRVLTGLSIAVLAFTEKIWNLPLGLAFLADHPFNFMHSLGINGVTDRQFLLMAATVELTFGLLLISGAFVRLVILVLWLPFNLTLPLLGWRELVGHLPIYGILALLLVWGEPRPDTETAMLEGVRQGEARAAARPAA